RKKTNEVKIYRGADEFREFMNDVYVTSRDKGGLICLHNAKPSNWTKWLGEDWFAMHSERMAKLENKIDFRITTVSGTQNFISASFAEYRWFPEELFNDQSVYAYGDKLAF